MDALLTVVVGAPALSSGLPNGDVLVIDPSPTHLAPLAADLGLSRTVVCETAVLATQPDELVPWFRYVDSRLDGIVAPELWQQFFPNAIALEQSQLRGERLEALLERWTAKGKEGRPIQLVLRKGNPLAALTGLGNWLGQLQLVHLVGPKSKEIWQEAVGAWLAERGFRRQPESDGAWERDPLASVILERDALRRQLALMDDQLSLINKELDNFTAKDQEESKDASKIITGNILSQILSLEESGRHETKERCRNCESTRVLKLIGAAHVAQFFALRVLGIRTLEVNSLRLDAVLCLECLFLTHLVELPEDNISRLYHEYRGADYNTDRIALEPGYSKIACLIGGETEIHSRVQGLDGYFEELRKREELHLTTDHEASALDWGGGNGKYIPSFVTDSFSEINVYDVSSLKQPTTSTQDPNSCISPKQKYKYVQFCHVLEHVQRPLEILGAIVENNLLELGLVYIEVPIEERMELFAKELLTNENAGYQVHEHINKYCLRSLRHLVEATKLLKIIDLREDVINVGWFLPDNSLDEIPIIRCLCSKINS